MTSADWVTGQESRGSHNALIIYYGNLIFSSWSRFIPRFFYINLEMEVL